MEKIWYKYWPKDQPHSLMYPTVSLPAALEEQAARTPEKTAIVYYGRTISYRELNAMVGQLAAALKEVGVKQGDRVSLFMDTSPNFTIAFYAILRLGAIVVPANPMFKEWELEHETKDAGIETIIASDHLYNVIAAIGGQTPLKTVILTSLSDFLPEQPTLPVHPSLLQSWERPPDTLDMLTLIRSHAQALPPAIPQLDLQSDLALIQYTSGTTGMPKGAMITHANILTNVAGSIAWNETQPEDVHLAVLPYFHVTGMVHSMAAPLLSGGMTVILSRFDLQALVQAISTYAVTCWVGIATMNIALINYPDLHKYRVDSLRSCTSGGAPIPLEVLKRFRELTGVTLVEGYGLSETISQVTINPREHPKLGTVGIPVYDVDVRIMSLEAPDKEVARGQEGELVFKGPQIMKGYWQRPEATAEVLQDGWLRTGDIGWMDEDGYITIVGRAKELIKASGYSVFPAEIESFFYKNEAIHEVAVIGVPDPYRGETIKAYVVLKPDYQDKVTEQDLLEWGRTHMAVYKAPRMVEIRQSLPHTGSGKLLKRLLAQEAREQIQRGR
ncbi:MAG: AMP-binding protein [Chloroflexi bacterium]|nr:AMP-binding protein [Chloroflexota bacterium]